jgi:nitroreductase
MELLKEIKNRYTVKSFVPGSINDKALERILEAGRMAPSAKNRQPWRFIVLQDALKREKLRDFCYGDERITQSGAVVAVCTTNIDYKMPNGLLSFPMDLTFAASFMLLQAEHEGLGTALLTTFRAEEICDFLSVPYGMKIALLLMIGEKKRGAPASRLPVERVVAHEHW